MVGDSHVGEWFLLLEGDYDDKLKFPGRFDITLELLNQHRDQDHYEKDIYCQVTRDRIGDLPIGSSVKFIPHVDLEWN